MIKNRVATLLNCSIILLTMNHVIPANNRADSSVCSFFEWIKLSFQMKNIDQDLVLKAIILHEPANIEAARKLICVMTPATLRESLALAIEKNAQEIIKLMVKRGLQLRSVSSTYYPDYEYTCDSECKDNPLHILAINSKNHSDPIGMAKLLVSLGAISQSDCYPKHLFPYDRPELDKSSELYEFLRQVRKEGEGYTKEELAKFKDIL